MRNVWVVGWTDFNTERSMDYITYLLMQLW